MSELQKNLPDDNNDENPFLGPQTQRQLTVKNLVLWSCRSSEVRLFCLQKKRLWITLTRKWKEDRWIAVNPEQRKVFSKNNAMKKSGYTICEKDIKNWINNRLGNSDPTYNVKTPTLQFVFLLYNMLYKTCLSLNMTQWK